MTLKNKKILIIIGGGIAAYKALDLIRLLKKENVEIKTILTRSGKEFVTDRNNRMLIWSRAERLKRLVLYTIKQINKSNG